MKHEFIRENLYFPVKGILVIGDLHLGYEQQLIQSGVLTPKKETQQVIDELRDIILELKEKQKKLQKIIFIGDIKHAFDFQYEEKFSFKEVLEFLSQYFKSENIIFIRGNHDTIDFTYGDMKDFYIEDDIAFIHGHKDFPEIYKKEIKTIVMGHIHPSVVFHDKETIKKETFKCFLAGEYKKKKVIILPSFLGVSIGSPINEYADAYEDEFSIIPKKQLLKFRVYVVGKDKVYEFKKVRDLLDA